jgi:ParB family chromosome partitioning protein
MAQKKSPGKTKSGKRSAAKRGKLAPRKEARGLAAAEIALGLQDAEIAALTALVEQAGGAAIGAYREPLSGRSLLLAAVPLAAVQPTPFQRDLSPTHARRLAERIDETGVFLDPLIAVRGEVGFWTPNGRHRLAAAKFLGLRQITALISPDESLAYRILALNTEKAHNLKDRSLEVVRMARSLAKREGKTAKESQFTAEFEAPELLTLGLVYEKNLRFGGGAYSPMLKKVDRWSDAPLATSLREREGYAARLEEIDAAVKRIVAQLQKRGFKSPYLRNYVVARINPVRFHKMKKGDTKPAMPIAAALTRMAAAAKKFNLDSVRSGDLAMVAAGAESQE